jgi:hypothetical protein
MGASIVAAVRGNDVIASPTPYEVLRTGDVLVVIGTHDGIAGVRRAISSMIHPSSSLSPVQMAGRFPGPRCLWQASLVTMVPISCQPSDGAWKRR